MASFFFFKQKTAYDMRISDWSSDVCSSDLGVAWTYSLVAVIAPHIFPPAFRGPHGAVGLYFEAAAVIVTLVLPGQLLELSARVKTGSALRALLDFSPKTAHLIDTGRERTTHLDLVSAGDRLHFKRCEAFQGYGV